MKTSSSLWIGMLACACLTESATSAPSTVQAGITGGGGTSTGGAYVLRGALAPEPGGAAAKSTLMVEPGVPEGGPLIVVTPGGPTLVISRQAEGLVISWSGGGPGYALEQATELNAEWKVIPGATASPVSVAPDAVTRYFRLRKP